MVQGRSNGRAALRGWPVKRVFAFFLLACLISLMSVAEARAARGSFAFYYTGWFTDEELAWFQRFDIVVPGYILPPAQVDTLHQAGSRIFYYAWSTGLYIDDPARLDPTSWEALVYRNRSTWLLNPNYPDAGPDGAYRSYYYDPFTANFKKAWTQELNSTLLEADYDGVFFDLVGSSAVPAYLQKVYASRHPKTSYDKSLADAFRQLKKKGSLIFTNQGFRTPQAYLSVSDYDLTESMMTSYAWGRTVQIYLEGKGLVTRDETFYRPWPALKADGDSIQANVARYNPAVRILHLNYTNPLYEPTGQVAWDNGVAYPVYREVIDRAAAFYGYAAAKLWGHESFSQGPRFEFTKEEIFFADLGQPLGKSYEERDGLVLRYYEKGVVVLNPSTASRAVDLSSPLVPPGVSGLQDLYDNVTVFGLAVTIDPTVSSASGQVYPSGRVYHYQN